MGLKYLIQESCTYPFGNGRVWTRPLDASSLCIDCPIKTTVFKNIVPLNPSTETWTKWWPSLTVHCVQVHFLMKTDFSNFRLSHHHNQMISMFKNITLWNLNIKRLKQHDYQAVSVFKHIVLLKAHAKLSFSGDLCVQEHQDGGGLTPHCQETACRFWKKVLTNLIHMSKIILTIWWYVEDDIDYMMIFCRKFKSQSCEELEVLEE